MTELEERQVRALTYILDEKPFIATSMEGRFIQIAYRVLPGTNRGFFVFLGAVRMFIRVGNGGSSRDIPQRPVSAIPLPLLRRRCATSPASE